MLHLFPNLMLQFLASAQVQGAVYAEDGLCRQAVMMDATSSVRNNATNHEPMPNSQLPIRNRDQQGNQGIIHGSNLRIWEYFKNYQVTCLST